TIHWGTYPTTVLDGSSTVRGTFTSTDSPVTAVEVGTGYVAVQTALGVVQWDAHPSVFESFFTVDQSFLVVGASMFDSFAFDGDNMLANVTSIAPGAPNTSVANMHIPQPGNQGFLDVWLAPSA